MVHCAVPPCAGSARGVVPGARAQEWLAPGARLRVTQTAGGFRPERTGHFVPEGGRYPDRVRRRERLGWGPGPGEGTRRALWAGNLPPGGAWPGRPPTAEPRVPRVIRRGFGPGARATGGSQGWAPNTRMGGARRRAWPPAGPARGRGACRARDVGPGFGRGARRGPGSRQMPGFALPVGATLGARPTHRATTSPGSEMARRGRP